MRKTEIIVPYTGKAGKRHGAFSGIGKSRLKRDYGF